MGTAGGPQDIDVVRWPIAGMLDSEPYRFEFFQAVRLLSRMYPNRHVAGRFNNPSEEVVRFGAHPDASFPASEIQALDRSQVPAMMRVNFMGLTGPLGILPLPYTSLVRERLREKDSSMRDFFDIFNHRIISLFCLAFEKYRFSIPYERGERDRFSYHVLALIGLGTPGLQDRQNIADDSLLFYSGLLSMHGRSAEALRRLLMDYYNVPVEIEQFVGVWRPVETASQCSFTEENDYSERLGFGAIVGDEIWDQQSRVRICLGPLTLAQYIDFLPGGEGHQRVRALTSFYAGSEYDMELQLILKRAEVPGCELSAAGQGPQLGWTSWVKHGEFGRDPGETILEL
jgi:type VI secretion system protein ImpH